MWTIWGSRFRFPMLSLEFFIYIILPQPLTEMSTRNIFWGKRRPMRRADKLTTFICRLSWNLGTSTSWKPLGLSMPLLGLLYLCEQIGRTPTAPTITGKWRIPFEEDLCDLYCSPKISRVITSRRMRHAGHVARMGDGRGAYWVLLGMLEGKRPGRIKVDL
jgi:hypothetical protein